MRSIKVDRVQRRLGHVRGKSVLDLGCGIGYVASICVDLGANVVACDFAETMVARTQQRYASRFPVIRASAESPPFRPQSFDVVLALDVIEHLYHPTEMLDATWTLLRPEGRLIITTDRPGFELGALPGRVVRGMSGLLSRQSRRGRSGRRPTKYDTPLCTHVHEYGIEELIELVQASGLRLSAFDTFPNRASFSPYGHFVELVGVGPLRRYKWGHCIYEFRKADSPRTEVAST